MSEQRQQVKPPSQEAADYISLAAKQIEAYLQGKDEEIEGAETREQSQEAAEYTRLATAQIYEYLQGKDEQMEGS